MIVDDYRLVKGKIGDTVALVAATKTVEVSRLCEAKAAGITVFGENRVQELLEKYPYIEGVSWHFIGHLQTNKVKLIVGKVDLIQSVDCVKLAEEIDRCAKRLAIVQDVLLEMNPAREESKSGFYFNEIDQALEQISKLQNLRILGLMAMMPKTENPSNNAIYYLQMKEKYDTIVKSGKYNFRYLSMGMSDDYEAAVCYGANMVRVGSALFGKRSYIG